MIKGRIISVGGPKAVARQFNPVVKEEMLRAAEVWWRKMLPKHFRVSAKSEYGYQKRSKGHQLRKARKYGHQRPLEFTGDLKRQVLRQSTITGTRTSVTVTLRGPRYLWQYRKDYKQPDKAGELTTTTEAESKQLIDRVDRRVARRLNSLTERETVTA